MTQKLSDHRPSLVKSGCLLSTDYLSLSFHTSLRLLVNPRNGRALDRTQDIADTFREDPEGMEQYREEKVESINTSYEQDVVTAQEDGVEPEEIESWKVTKNQLLSDLAYQIRDAQDLAGIESHPEDQDHVSVPSSPGTTHDSSSSSDGSSVSGSPMHTAPSLPVTFSPSVSATAGAAPLNPSASAEKGSLLDDFADTSTEMPDYYGGED